MNTPRTPQSPIISRRPQAAGPLHHLWNNHGHWWIHYTLHLPDFTARRVRKCLGTKDLATAMARRDRILSDPSAADHPLAA